MTREGARPGRFQERQNLSSCEDYGNGIYPRLRNYSFSGESSTKVSPPIGRRALTAGHGRDGIHRRVLEYETDVPRRLSVAGDLRR